MMTGERARILVVDDDARTMRVLSRMLREDGFEVESATDGAAAIARFGRDPLPDALVTDLHLPHADGLAVARYAESRRPGIRVYVVTGYPELVAKDPLMPEERVFVKPLDYGKLSKALAG